MSGKYGWDVESTEDFLGSEGQYVNMPIPVDIGEGEPSDDTNSNPCVKGYYWCANVDELPPDAVKSGLDKDGGEIYIGRAIHEGGIHPAKIVPNHGCAYIAYDGEEIPKDEYEILCRGRCAIIWQECQDGMVPHNAVVGGCTTDNEKLYIGRVFYDGTHTPGKIQPSQSTCYVPYDGEALSFSTYEVLVLK